MLVILDKLNFYLYKFWGFLKPRRKLGLVSFVVLASFVLVVWVVGTNVAHAAGVLDDVGDFFGWHPIDALANGIFQMIINIMLQIARWFIQLTFWILKFVIEIGGYNGYIDSPAVTVGWVMVRDITNMFFVVVLLIISFGTILGLEQYEYKKLLVKLLMAAVIVNFSRIICGIIIDVAQVIMITFINGIAATGDGNLLKMFHIEAMYKLKGGTAGSGVFMTAVAAITFASIMMVTMLTFLFLLLARMVMLWILIVLSPFAFVLNVLPQTQKYAGQWWSEFGGNVVAGPIIAFFLWLSFVTVGAGDARTHLANNSTTSWKEGATPQETTTGITEIMSWENMANFAIAIGMLLAGAKMAQQLGAAGGSMMGKAGEFGKKVAMVASGASAARWAGKGAWNVAKKKAPLIGTESMERHKLKAQLWATRKGNKWNDALGGNKAGRFGRMFQVGRGAKVKEELEKHLKSAQSRMGTATNVEDLKRESDKLAGEDRARKKASDAKHAHFEAKSEKAFLESPEEGAKYTEKIKMAEEAETDLARVKTGLETDYAKSGGGKNLATAQAEAEKAKLALGTVQKEVTHAAETGAGLPEAKAAAEQKEMAITRDKEIRIAEERDKLIPGGGNFADAARAKHVKEDLERDGAISFDKNGIKIDSINAEIGKLRANTARTPEQDNQLKALEEAIPNAVLASVSRGSVLGTNAIDRTLKQVGGKHDVTADINDQNLEAQQANILGALLDRAVAVDGKGTDVDAALVELERKKGAAFMEQVVDRFNVMAENGQAGYAGNFKLDPGGKVRRTTEKDREYIEGKRDWAVAQSKFGKMGFDGAVDSEKDSKGDTKVFIKTAQALQNTAKMFTGTTAQNVNRIDPSAIATLVAAMKNGGENGAQKIIEYLAKTSKKDGVEALLMQINEGLDKQSAGFKVKYQAPPEGAGSAGGSTGGGGSAPSGGGGTTSGGAGGGGPNVGQEGSGKQSSKNPKKESRRDKEMEKLYANYDNLTKEELDRLDKLTKRR